MVPAEEFSDEEIKVFTDANPNIAIERVDPDATKLAAMIAAGTPPDIIRGSGADVPLYVTRGWVMDLTKYFQNSQVIKIDDLAPANTYFLYKGAWYGMMKDWSPDFAFNINKRMATAAGITLPPPNSIITYKQMGEWAKRMTIMDGSRVVTMGNEGIGGDGDVQNILRETGQDLYSEDFSHANIKNNPTVVEFLTYAAQLAKEGVTYSPTNPSPGWGVPDLEGGQVASMQMGYWEQAQFLGDAATSVEKPSDFVMYPALSWGGTKVSDPSAGGAGWFISVKTQNPDAAWKLFEYYMAGEPAITRAKAGWGVPALKSLMVYMDVQEPWQKQFLATVQWELANADTSARRINPYYSTDVFNTIWATQLEQYLKGEITIDQAITNLDTEVNKAIANGMAAAK
jgi:multiple sugar transport system substrate-binding protein